MIICIKIALNLDLIYYFTSNYFTSLLKKLILLWGREPGTLGRINQLTPCK